MSIAGQEKLEKIWPALRAASDGRKRNELIDAAITAVAWHQQAVHEARIAALQLLRHGDDTNQQTKRLVSHWARDYRGDT